MPKGRQGRSLPNTSPLLDLEMQSGGKPRSAKSAHTNFQHPAFSFSNMNFRLFFSGATFPFLGYSQTNVNSSLFSRTGNLLGREESTPLGETGGAVGFEILSAAVGSLLVQMIVD